MNPQTHVIGSILDTKSGVYWSPQLFRSNADFIRSVQIGAKDPSTMLHKFPGDYELIVVGGWDEKAGISNTDGHRLGTVLDLCPLS